jgi:hypothetical protein
VPLPPGATLAAEDAVTFAVTSLPEGPWAGGPPPAVGAEGAVTRRAWRVAEGGLTPDQLLAPIRDALVADGFTVLYTCADRACGGYDFRFGLDLLPAPAMFVDLGNYRYLVAEADTEDGRRLVAVVTSTGLGAGYVHVTTVDPAAQPVALPDLQGPPAPDAAAPAPWSPHRLRRISPSASSPTATSCSTGSTSRRAPPPSRPTATKASSSSPPSSPRTPPPRSSSSATRTPPARSPPTPRCPAPGRRRSARDSSAPTASDGDRITAEGAGFLAPVASNLTPEGQAANRRVEAVLLSAP